MECLANKPAPCIGHDTPFSALFDDFITHRRSGRPIAAQEHFLSSCHTFLLPQLVVKFPEKEKHFLLHLSGGVGGVYRLCYRYDLDAEFPEFVGEPDRKSTRLNSNHVKNSYAGLCLIKKKLSFDNLV